MKFVKKLLNYYRKNEQTISLPRAEGILPDFVKQPVIGETYTDNDTGDLMRFNEDAWEKVNFPPNPLIGDTHRIGLDIYTWHGDKWWKISLGNPSATLINWENATLVDSSGYSNFAFTSNIDTAGYASVNIQEKQIKPKRDYSSEPLDTDRMIEL